MIRGNPKRQQHQEWGAQENRDPQTKRLTPTDSRQLLCRTLQAWEHWRYCADPSNSQPFGRGSRFQEHTHTHTHPLEHCPHSILVGHKSLVCIKLFCEAVFTLPEEIHVKLEDVTMWQWNWFGICEFDYCDTENEISVVWCDLPTDLPDLILYVFVIMLCFF